jgi:hypothetical protein
MAAAVTDIAAWDAQNVTAEDHQTAAVSRVHGRTLCRQ